MYIKTSECVIASQKAFGTHLMLQKIDTAIGWNSIWNSIILK